MIILASDGEGGVAAAAADAADAADAAFENGDLHSPTWLSARIAWLQKKSEKKLFINGIQVYATEAREAKE